MSTHLAVDLGAENGRVVLGRFEGSRVTLEEIRRFPTGVVSILGHKYWDLLRLYEDVLQALKAASSAGLSSLGVDTWASTSCCLTQRANRQACRLLIATDAPMA